MAEYPGVYALPAAGRIPYGPDCSAVLAGGPGTLLSYGSAGVLWRMRRGVADPVHITVPYGRRGPGGARLTVHRTKLLHPADSRIHQGLPVTSPARTLLDVATGLPDREVEQMLDEALFIQRIVTRRDIGDLLRRAGGHPGRVRLTRVLGDPAPRRRTGSRPEERLLQMVLASGLPEPQTQAHILGYELDMFWPLHHLAVEVDTYGTHGSPRRFAADRRRDARLLAERGIIVLRFTDVQIDGRPLEVIATLARALGGGGGR